MDNWQVKAYQMVDGKEELREWAAGFTHFAAAEYFKSLRRSKEYSKIEMNKV